jgi:hypothetical protein
MTIVIDGVLSRNQIEQDEKAEPENWNGEML